MWALAEVKLTEKQNKRVKKLDGFSYSAAVKKGLLFLAVQRLKAFALDGAKVQVQIGETL